MVEDPRLTDLVHLAMKAMDNGQKMRVVLFDGTVVEGPCTATLEDAEGRALPDATPHEEAMLGPVRREITIGDQAINVADITSLDALD